MPCITQHFLKRTESTARSILELQDLESAVLYDGFQRHFISAAESRDKSLHIKFTVDSGCKAYYIRQQRIPQSLNRTDFRKIKIIWTDTHLIVMNTMFGVVLELYCLWCLSSVLSGKYGGMCFFYNFSKVP